MKEFNINIIIINISSKYYWFRTFSFLLCVLFSALNYL